MRAFETTGRIDSNHELHLDRPLPVEIPGRVRIIVLLPDQSEPGETEWLKAASSNPAFDFLNSPQEDIYTTEDGKPFNDQG
jgi:hypothetical protein